MDNVKATEIINNKLLDECMPTWVKLSTFKSEYSEKREALEFFASGILNNLPHLITNHLGSDATLTIQYRNKWGSSLTLSVISFFTNIEKALKDNLEYAKSVASEFENIPIKINMDWGEITITADNVDDKLEDALYCITKIFESLLPE